MKNNPYQSYNNAQVMTATPGELTLLLYNGAIRFMKLALQAMEDKKVEQSHKNLIKTQDIIYELMSTLKMEYEISANLMALYEFMNSQLVQANVKKETKPVQDVLDLMTDLRDTWVEAIKRARLEGAGAHA